MASPPLSNNRPEPFPKLTVCCQGLGNGAGDGKVAGSFIYCMALIRNSQVLHPLQPLDEDFVTIGGHTS